MNAYIPNKACDCPRCRARGLTGAAILVTLGILFLLAEFHILSIHQTWPVLLIVIGLFTYLSTTGSTEGHIDPPRAAGAMPPPPPPANIQGPEVHP